VGHSRISGGQVAHRIDIQEKESPETFGFRIHDLAKPKILIEVTGHGKVNSHVCVGVSTYRVSGVSKTRYLVSRVANSR
jgi:hypothetical protein